MASNSDGFDLPDVTARDATGLARNFRYFGDVETPRLDSEVYTAFSLCVAEDAELLDLVAAVDPGQPAPNVLFAAVQDLLLEDATRSEEAVRLSAYYPAVSRAAIPSQSPAGAFRAFCLRHADELRPKLRAGRTQTCIVHRCTTVLSALASLPRVSAASGRVALLEIGPSAGLNLRLDRYKYVYRDDRGREVTWGALDVKPVLECKIRGDVLPPVPGDLDIVARRGLDLNPIDLGDPLQLRWLRALIWPEHVERARLMDEAIEHAASVPIEIGAGDATRDREAADRCAASLVCDSRLLSDSEGRPAATSCEHRTRERRRPRRSHRDGEHGAQRFTHRLVWLRSRRAPPPHDPGLRRFARPLDRMGAPVVTRLILGDDLVPETSNPIDLVL